MTAAKGEQFLGCADKADKADKADTDTATDDNVDTYRIAENQVDLVHVTSKDKDMDSNTDEGESC